MTWNVWRLLELTVHKNLTNIYLCRKFTLHTSILLIISGHFKRFQLNHPPSQLTKFVNIFLLTPYPPPPEFFSFYIYIHIHIYIKKVIYTLYKSNIKVIYYRNAQLSIRDILNVNFISSLNRGHLNMSDMFASTH